MYSLKDAQPVEGQSIFSHSGWENPQVRNAGNPNNFSSESLIPKANLYKELRNEDLVFKENLYNEFDDVNLTEEADKYLIRFKDSKKEMKLDINKEENELKLEIYEKSSLETGEESYFTHFESAIKFDKPVKFDEIFPENTNGIITIIIPKVHRDTEKSLNMQLKNTSVDNLRK